MIVKVRVQDYFLIYFTGIVSQEDKYTFYVCSLFAPVIYHYFKTNFITDFHIYLRITYFALITIKIFELI